MAIDDGGCARALAPIALLGLLLAGCASQPGGSSGTGGAYRDGQGAYRVGRPYEIKGVWYYPAVDYDYDRTGIASWYGGQFEGRLTANGEIFDLNQLTAAHTTLPMPSTVQVTHLGHGPSLQLRVNDRGPFVDGRLIDVSRRAAQLLGFESTGTTLVRVKVLKDESIAAAEEAVHGSGQILVADAAPAAAAPVVAPAAAYSAPPAPPSPVEVPAPPSALAAPPLPAPPRQATHMQPRLAQIAVAPSPPPLQTSTPPPPLPRMTAPAPSRFALIAPAEAAELPPAEAPSRKPRTIEDLISAAHMPSSPPTMTAAARTVSGRIYVQAGAFSLRDNARRVQSRVARLGNAEVTAASVSGIELYRVRLGPFASAQQADRLLARVVESGYPGARIVGD